MTLENNFINHSKEYIFSNNKILSNQRESIFKRIFQKNYDKKNNESLKTAIISSSFEEEEKESFRSKINNEYSEIIKKINENSNIQIITKNKTEDDVLGLLDELIKDHKEQSNLKKIESLEQKLINNLDENSYSELIKLKSQLNGE